MNLHRDGIMENHFSFETRVLACTNCGAPITSGLTGGQTNCDYCGAANRIIARSRATVGSAAVPPPESEEERMMILRQQDNKPATIPSVLQPLLHNGALPDWKLEEALTLWNRLRAKLEKEDEYQNAEALYFLTILLTNHRSFENEPLRIRALYESTLDVFTLPRHRQSVYCLLARNAAREGNLQGAEEWLRPCNPRPTDLMSDSDYRITRAYIDTFRKDYPSVLQQLGSTHGHIPVYSTLDALSIVIRANALEEIGQTDQAAAELFLLLSATGIDGTDTVERILRGIEHAGGTRCAEGLRIARSRIGNIRMQQATRSAGMGGIGPVFATIGTLFVLASTIMVVLVLSGAAPGAILTALPALGIIGIVFSLIGWKGVLAKKKIKRLYEKGRVCNARVIDSAPTGWKINDVPQYLIRLHIIPPEAEPYETAIKLLGQHLSPGSQVRVKADPENPESVLYLP